MLPDYKPSKVYLGMSPLGACYGKCEAECAAAVIVWTCQVQGDEWSEFLPLRFMGEVLKQALDTNPIPEPVKSWNRNPFFRPDFELLVSGLYIERATIATEKGYLLLPKFFEPLSRWVIT